MAFFVCKNNKKNNKRYIEIKNKNKDAKENILSTKTQYGIIRREIKHMSNEYYVKPEKPFLLIYESREDGVSVAWLETEEDLTDVIEEVKSYGCTIIDAIEIGSYRDIEY